MKTLEWHQSKERPDEIIVRAVLRGGKIAIISLDSEITNYLTRFCVLHLEYAGQREEEFLCDFKQLRNDTARDRKGFASSQTNQRSLIVDLSLGRYSIRNTEKGRLWLGRNGWQEERFNFDIPAPVEQNSYKDLDNRETRQPRFRKAHLVASAAVVLLTSISVPFVFGYFGAPSSAKPDNQTASIEVQQQPEVASLKKDEKAIENVASEMSREPSTPKEKHVIKSKPVAKLKHAHKKMHTAQETVVAESGIEIQCTQDMIEKGISCK